MERNTFTCVINELLGYLFVSLVDIRLRNVYIDFI